MCLRLVLLVMSVPMMVCGAVVKVCGMSAVPYEVRYTFPVSWAVDYPTLAFFGSGVVFLIAMLARSRKAVLINDFRS